MGQRATVLVDTVYDVADFGGRYTPELEVSRCSSVACQDAARRAGVTIEHFVECLIHAPLPSLVVMYR